MKIRVWARPISIFWKILIWRILSKIWKVWKLTPFLQSRRQAAGSRFEDELTGISGSLGECKENYRSIRELSSERRYTPHAGNYGKLLEQDEKLREGFAAVADDHSWVDGTWVTQPACGGRSRRDKRGGSNFGIVCADTAES